MQHLVTISMIIAMLLSGGSSGAGDFHSSLQNEALMLGKTVKSIQYEVDDYTKVKIDDSLWERYAKIKPYLTEKAFNSFLRNRELLFPIQVAIQQKANIKVKSIVFEKQSEKQGELTYHYVMEIELLYSDGKPSKVIKTNGQMDFVKEGDTVKVSRDWDGYPLVKEYE